MGADRTKGWARPMRICPSVRVAKPDLREGRRAPRYRSQFPARRRSEAVRREERGGWVCRRRRAKGEASRKEKRKEVLSQFMMEGVAAK